MSYRNTTLCYIEKDGQYLMLLRNKKKVDENKNKWIGVGGKFLDTESPEECLIREVFEETGLTLLDYKMNGIVTFVSDEWGTEYMYLYTGTKFTGELKECDEGLLQWVPIKDVMNLNLWEGDKLFLDLMVKNSPFFTMKLEYEGDTLVSSKTKIYD